MFNGNIGAMAVNIKQFSQPLVYMYGYDQLNRLMNATTYNGWNGVSTFAPSTINDYKEQLTYDPNGNIQTALRNGNSTQISLENFTYNYDATNKNKLLNIQNSVGNITSNYSYDAIGEETKDDLEGNTNLTWTVYGKIKSVTKTDGTIVTYTYDAAGNRIGKQVAKSGLSSYEWYVRDASGNTMAVYNQSTAGVLTQREVNLYGSTLIGLQKRNIDADAAMLNLSAIGQRGMKQYFLGNHLGNTLTIISDKKYAAVVTGGVVTAYKPDVLSATDYSSFGVSLLGRQFNGSSLEYGFNGKWNEVETGYQNYGMRDYSERGRRFTKVDPLTGKYPWYTPYLFAGNKPILTTDLDGLEDRIIGDRSRIEYEILTQNGVSHKDAVKAVYENSKLRALGVVTAVSAAFTLGSSTELTSAALLKNIGTGGVVGSIVNSTISALKGESTKDIIKSGVAGFLGGAILGAGSSNTIAMTMLRGEFSGVVEETTNQLIEKNVLSSRKTYNVNQIIAVGFLNAIGTAGTQVLSEGLEKVIDDHVTKSIAEINTKSYKNSVKEFFKLTGTKGDRALNIAANKFITGLSKDLTQQGEAFKNVIKQAVERGSDVVSDKAKDASKKKVE